MTNENWKAATTRDNLNFPVGTRKVFAQTGEQFQPLARKVTWNERDNTSLEGYITDRYHILTHKEVFDSIDLVTKNLGLTPQKTRILANDNMSRMTAYITLAGHQTAVDVSWRGRGITKDDWDVGFTVSNALDGSGSVRVSPYIERLVCTNGLRTTKILGHESVTHAHSQIQGWFESTIDKVINDLEAQFPMMSELSTIMVDKSTFLVTVENTLGKRFVKTVREQLNSPPIDNPLYNITPSQLSLYDGLSLLTYNNHNKASNRTADGVNESYRQVESIIEHFQKPENRMSVTA